ncbi:MAG: GWxTD domain-containing protein [Candidatus Cloacimonetes bacterium]|nr:GWxTD domain-containing protein [Candidatus Cloacimonadota bacterium]
MKLILALLLLGLMMPLVAAEDTLNLYVEALRFPQLGNTRVEINYKIPYASLAFVAGEYGYEASVEVAIDVLRSDGYRTIKTFTNKILTADPYAPSSASRYYLDKISLDLNDELNLRLRFTDTVSGATHQWTQQLTLLPPDGALSDLELVSSVSADTTRYLEKFHRLGRLFVVHPDHIFTALQNDTLWVYAEMMATPDEIGLEVLPVLTVTGGEIDSTLAIAGFTVQAGFNEILLPLRLVGISEGYYSLRFDLQIPGRSPLTRESYFLRREPRAGVWRLFEKIEDEKQLLGYFLPRSQLRPWDNLTDTGRMHFLDRFWTSHDPTPGTPENEFFTLVQERIRFTNEQYGVYQPGWKTDRGRIYIRLGAPDSVDKKTSSGSAPVGGDIQSPSAGLMGARDYHVWKYYQEGSHRTYLFFDKQTSGDLKLIYVDGDEKEVGDPSWRFFMGSDFDETDLQR